MVSLPVIFTFEDFDGLEWRFSFSFILGPGIYGASLVGKRYSCISPWIDFSELSDGSGFNVFFESSFFSIPISQFEKFKEFLQRAKAAKEAA